MNAPIKTDSTGRYINFLIAQLTLLIGSLAILWFIFPMSLISWLGLAALNLIPLLLFLFNRKVTGFQYLNGTFWILLVFSCLVISQKTISFFSTAGSIDDFPKLPIGVFSFLLILLTYCFYLIRAELHLVQGEKTKYLLYNDKSAETFIFISAAILLTNSLFLFVSIGTSDGELSFTQEILLRRGIIPYIIVIFSFWTILLLIQNYFRTIFEKEVYKGYLDLEREISVSEKYLKNYFSTSLVKDRLDLTISLQRKGNEVDEVLGLLNETLPAQHQEYFSNYNILNYLTWGIPVLGFIGTVWGISQSIEEIVVALSKMNNTSLAEQSSSEFLSEAVKPLAIAFDTTLLALSISAFLLLLIAFLRRNEEQFFSSLEKYIQREIIRYFKRI